MTKRMLFAYTGLLKNIDLAIHEHSKTLEEKGPLEGRYQSDLELRKKILAINEKTPYIFYREVVGTKNIKRVRDEMIEPYATDVFAYGIARQDKIDLNDPNIEMIASNFNLKSLKIFADGYKVVREN